MHTLFFSVTENVQTSHLEAVASSVHELYNALIYDCGAFLPERQYVNGDWCAELTIGKRPYFKQNEIVAARLPSVKKLRTEDLLRFVKDNGGEPYLCPPKKSGKPVMYNRKWLIVVRFYFFARITPFFALF